MNTDEVGKFRFCPACGRPSKESEYGSGDELEEQVCTCCNRPWIACPCSPATEGECKAEIKSKIK